MNNTVLINRASEIVKSHNDRSEFSAYENKPVYEGVNLVKWEKVFHPEYMDKIEFTGNTKCDGTKKELIPNEKNPGLMDVAKITSYSGEFVIYKRNFGGKKIRKMVVWYFLSDEIERVEIGSYYDKRD